MRRNERSSRASSERRHRQIAPRLLNGASRENWGGRLPDYIKAGIRAIAAQENRSVSWVLERTVIRFFKLREPQYIQRKPRKSKGRAK